MNAYQYIQKNGLESIVNGLAQYPIGTTHYLIEGYFKENDDTGIWFMRDGDFWRSDFKFPEICPYRLYELKQAIADFEMFKDARSKMFSSSVSDFEVRNWFLNANKGLLTEKGLFLIDAIKRIEQALSEG